MTIMQEDIVDRNEIILTPMKPLLIGDMGMVTWRDGSEKLMALVVERRPAEYWKLRKKRKLRSGHIHITESGQERQYIDEECSIKNSRIRSSINSQHEIENLKADEVH